MEINKFLTLAAVITLLIQCSTSERSDVFESDISLANRVWIGPEYWANPLQDWRISNGRIECVTSGGDRNVFLLTHHLDSVPGNLNMNVTIGRLGSGSSAGWVGFKVGIRGEFNDYRDSAVRGEGMPVGLTSNGKLFIGFIEPDAPEIAIGDSALKLSLKADPEADGTYRLALTVQDNNNNTIADLVRVHVQAHWLNGGLALACSATPPLEVNQERAAIEYPDWGTEANTERLGDFRFWFNEWKIRGSKVKYHPERAYGPILFTQFTVNHNMLKLTAQLPPVEDHPSHQVYLQFKSGDSLWQTSDSSSIDGLSRTSTFQATLPDPALDTPYRIMYSPSGQNTEHYFEGVIPKAPAQEEVVVAAFTGNNDLGFPNSDLVHSVSLHQPDLLFFSGDQIYEGVGGYGAQRSPMNEAVIDYLRKWYMFGWTYRDLMKNIPSVAIPDDHDVYHGNIWGEGGKPASSEGSHHDQQDSGGYKMYPEWVNMVQRTQTSHLPEPFDPKPVQQGIEVYYTSLEYGGLSFAIIEDRKFKSAPKALLPEAEITNGWIQNTAFDAIKQSDHPQAKLLGERQHQFLNWWVEHWDEDTWMKVLLSQTIFSNVATLPRSDAMHDRIVPQLRILEAGEYAPDDIQVSDMDSNGWPQSGRNQAIKTIRKAFAFHIAGDQHLGSTIQYGVDEFMDSGFALCVPSVSNVWPRRWYPPKNPQTQSYTGNYLDGFGNRMSVLAVSNPVFTGRKPAKLYDRATGYGIVRFNRDTRDITIENWPRDANPAKDRPYPGWPIRITQKDNFNPPDGAYLPLIEYQGNQEPLVQALTATGELVLSIRIHESTTALKVPKPGNYLLKASVNGSVQEHSVTATTGIDNRGTVTLIP